MSSKREKASRYYVGVIRPQLRQMRAQRLAMAKKIYSGLMESAGLTRRDNRLQRKQLRTQQKRG